MRKKKVLFTISNFNIGGPQKSLLALLNKIDHNRYECYLMVLSGEGSLLKYLSKDVIVLSAPLEIRYALISIKELKASTVNMLKNSNYKLVVDAFNALFEGRKIKNMGQARQKYWVRNSSVLPKLDTYFDVAIGVSGGHSMMYVADCVEAAKKISWIRSDYRVLKRNLEIDNLYFDKMESILSVSNECRIIFNKLFPKHSHKTITMYNVLPTGIYKNLTSRTSLIENDSDTTNILTICRLDPDKGIDLALDAMSILIEKERKIKWFILGDGKKRKDIEKIISEKKLEGKFILLGFHLNTIDFIDKSDIVVHPSRFEGKSNVVDEAKYLNKPIIATRYETVKEQIEENENGLIAEMNGQSIADKIETMMDNDTMRERLIKNLSKEIVSDESSLEIFYNTIE